VSVAWDEIQKFLGANLLGKISDAEGVTGDFDLMRLFESGINQFLS
jgi:hypothetical protein